MNMKKILMAVLVSLVAFTACENYGDDNHKFDNVVYLDVASTSDAQLTTSATPGLPTIARCRRY